MFFHISKRLLIAFQVVTSRTDGGGSKAGRVGTIELRLPPLEALVIATASAPEIELGSGGCSS